MTDQQEQEQEEFNYKRTVLGKAQKKSRGSKTGKQHVLDAAEEVTETLLSNHYNNIMQEIHTVVQTLDEMKQEEDKDADTIEEVQEVLMELVEENYGE